jgi:hypothetical protein
MPAKGSGLPENYTRFYQGELRMRLAAAPAPVRPHTVGSLRKNFLWPSWVEIPRPESGPGTATFSTFLTYKGKISTSGLGRLVSFSEILYKDFIYFRVRDNDGPSPGGRV